MGIVTDHLVIGFLGKPISVSSVTIPIHFSVTFYVVKWCI